MKAASPGSNEELRVIFAGGGTGGHIMPGAAVAESICEVWPKARCLFLGTGRKTEDQCRPALRAFESARAPAGQWGSILQKVQFPAVSAVAAARSWRLMRRFRPHVVVGLGGYSCVAPVVVARIMGLPTMLLESNARPGRVVRTLARTVDCVQLQWAQAAPGLRPRRLLVSGNPVRRGILGVRREAALIRLGLRPGRRTLLVMGGSQGALALNRVVAPALRLMTMPGGIRPERLQVLHLTGADHLREAGEAELPEELIYHPMAFLHRMGDAYAAADLALARAGGSTLAELTAVGLPSVLVPYPYAADDHQRANANVLAEAGAAKCIVQSRLAATKLAALLTQLLLNEQKLAYMARSARRLGRPHAARTVALALGRLGGVLPPARSVAPDEDQRSTFSEAA